MSELPLTDNQAAALSGTTDTDVGATYPSATQKVWQNAGYRLFEWFVRAFRLANDLRVFEVADNADAIGVRAGRVKFGATALAYAGADPAVDALTDNDVTYVWLYNSGGTATIASAIDGTGWPAYPHYKLAEVTMSGGVITAILDRRIERCSDVILPTYTDGTRPAAGTAGRMIWNSDDNMPNIDDGAAWRDPAGSVT